MFLKKKELDPDWTDNTFTWEIQGAKNKSWDIKDAKNYIGGFDPAVMVKDPTRMVTLVPPKILEYERQREERRQLNLQQPEASRSGGILTGLASFFKK